MSKLTLRLLFAFVAAVWLLLQTAASVSAQATQRVMILLLPDDTCQVGKTPLKMSELPLALRVLAGLPEKPLVAIKADKEVLYERVVQALDACRRAGLEEITFVVPPTEEGR